MKKDITQLNFVPSPKRLTGFTLIEVLIALVVFAIVAFGIYGILNQTLYAQNIAEKRLNLIMNANSIIYPSIDNYPDSTDGWADTEKDGIDAQKISRQKIGIYDIIKLNWSFKKNGTVISYTFYY